MSGLESLITTDQNLEYQQNLSACRISIVVLEKRLKMAAKVPAKKRKTSDELGLKLLESVRQMNAGNFARVTYVQIYPIVQARRLTGL